MKSRKQHNRITFKDTVAGKIAAEIVRRQLWLSRRLSQWEQKLSKAQRKWLFLLFVGIAGGYCGFLLANGLLGTGHATKQHQRLPVVPVDPGVYDSLRLPVPDLRTVEGIQNKNSKQ